MFCFQGFFSIILLGIEIYIVNLFYKEQKLAFINKSICNERKIVRKYKVRPDNGELRDIQIVVYKDLTGDERYE